MTRAYSPRLSTLQTVGDISRAIRPAGGTVHLLPRSKQVGTKVLEITLPGLGTRRATLAQGRQIAAELAPDITLDTEVGPLVARIGEELLYQYPEGDADMVILIASPPLTAPGQVEVRLPDGRERLVDPAFLISMREEQS